MKALVLIPAYNEARHLPELLRRLAQVHPLQDTLVVDDGSEDETAAVAQRAGAQVLRYHPNRGKGYAQRQGFAFALERGYEAVITLDADLQHDPALIPAFLQKAQEGYDLVIGSRFHNLHAMPRDRYLSNRLTTLVLSTLTGERLRDTQSGYRLIRRWLLQRVRLRTCRYQTESELLYQAVRLGARIGYVPIPVRYAGEPSHINRFVDTLRFIWLSLTLLWR